MRHCKNCERRIAWSEAFKQWYHMDGMGRFCRKGAEPREDGL